MTPHLRKALHQCVDILCDALADAPTEKARRTRREPELPPVSEEAIEAAKKAWEKKGWRNTG